MGGGGQVVVARLRLHNVRDQHVLAVPCDNIQIDLMSGGFGFPFRFLHLRITSMLSMLVCPHLVQAKELDQRSLVQGQVRVSARLVQRPARNAAVLLAVRGVVVWLWDRRKHARNLEIIQRCWTVEV